METYGASVYQEKFKDPMGIFFTENDFPELKTARDKGDVSRVLQEAILRLTKEQAYGILYIPEGIYPIAHTVMIPKAVRLIGYGKKRPVFVLPEDAKGFEKTIDCPREPGWGQDLGANYMIWFIGNSGVFDPKDPESISDANPGTFYSALSNIDFRIEGNHPGAVCIRAHFAQHAFISHCRFDVGTGYAAIYDVGNEMEDLDIHGGTYGIMCRTTAPGWPFVLVDSSFTGQKEAAVISTANGFTGIRLRAQNTKHAFATWNPDIWEKLYLEDCCFEQISEAVITAGESGNVGQQMNLKNIACKSAGDFVYRVDRNDSLNLGTDYTVKSYTAGYLQTDLMEAPEFKELYEVSHDSTTVTSDIPLLPAMEKWTSVLDFGAQGDGETDDTKALQKALDSGKVLYFPQGMYRVTDTLFAKCDVCLIGLHPATTQILIKDDEPAFSGFGGPKAVLETAKGIRVIMNGIAVDTAAKNPRAAGIIWSADEKSYMNDVKLMGGHGLMYRDGTNPFLTLYNPSRTADYYPERKWDYQYASLWICNNGGGIFKDVWSCSPYAEAGIAITDTGCQCRMYGISLEHHVRHEIKINNVENLKIYGLQTEEEKAEGTACLPMEIVSSKNVEIINYYMFRVVSVDAPYDAGIRVWNVSDVRFLNLRNMAQMQYTFTVDLKDQNSGFVAKSSDYAYLEVTGRRPHTTREKTEAFEILSTGYSFAQGLAVRKKGNIYWCDKKYKTIYCYEPERDTVYPILDIHYMPAALCFDTDDNLIVSVDYQELKKEAGTNHFGDRDWSEYHPYFSWFYKRGEKAYSVDPDHPYISIKALEKVEAEDIKDLDGRPVIRCGELDYPGNYDMMIKRKLTHYYKAPDGVTLVEGTKDIARALVLNTYTPGETGIVTDDFLRKSHEYDVCAGGNFSGGKQVAGRGMFGAVKDDDGVVWTIEDRIYGFKDGKLISTLEKPWDAYTLRFCHGRMYVIGRGSVYLKAER